MDPRKTRSMSPVWGLSLKSWNLLTEFCVKRNLYYNHKTERTMLQQMCRYPENYGMIYSIAVKLISLHASHRERRDRKSCWCSRGWRQQNLKFNMEQFRIIFRFEMGKRFFFLRTYPIFHVSNATRIPFGYTWSEHLQCHKLHLLTEVPNVWLFLCFYDSCASKRYCCNGTLSLQP